VEIILGYRSSKERCNLSEYRFQRVAVEREYDIVQTGRKINWIYNLFKDYCRSRSFQPKKQRRQDLSTDLEGMGQYFYD
jgi:hypothetical protein